MGGQTSCEIKKDLTGQVVFITGANTGIGKETALRLASHNANLILGCRSEERTKPVIEEIKQKYPNCKVDFFRLDLGDLDQVVECAKQVKAKYEKIDTLLNNAGVMMVQERTLTKQGFEMQIGTNHFGHFVLTNHLLPLIKKSPKGRVVNVSSLAHYGFPIYYADIKMDDLNFEKRKYSDTIAYNQSKLANVVFTKSLQKELEKQNSNVVCVSLHPGAINTELGRHINEDGIFIKRWGFNAVKLFFKTPIEGAQTNIYCCLEDQEKLVKGAYYTEMKTKEPSKKAKNTELQDQFWKFSNEQVKQYLIQW